MTVSRASPLRVERHHDRVADPGLRVADGAVLADDPAHLVRVEGVSHEVQEPGRPPGRYERRDRVIALGDRPDLSARMAISFASLAGRRRLTVPAIRSDLVLDPDTATRPRSHPNFMLLDSSSFPAQTTC